MKKKNIKIFFALFFLILLIFLYVKLFKKNIPEITNNSNEDFSYNANIIKNVSYISTDARGNQYIINAAIGEIDFSDSNVIYLTDVNALIKLNNSKNITIVSDYGKYNSNNFDTIFSKNVTINHLDNEIIGEYADFSIKRNSMIISRNVVYTNTENILKADVVEIDIETKDTRIFMYKNKNQVNIKSKN
tara:strand:+ start:700 stop:1266 length:567 start_codon:yes stop_codon:yes gene_type:complete